MDRRSDVRRPMRGHEHAARARYAEIAAEQRTRGRRAETNAHFGLDELDRGGRPLWLPHVARASRGRAGAAVPFAGLAAASRRDKGEHAAHPTLFLTLEDEEGLLETVVGEARYAELDPRITTPGPYLVEGAVKLDYGRVYLEASTIWPFHMRARKFAAGRAP